MQPRADQVLSRIVNGLLLKTEPTLSTYGYEILNSGLVKLKTISILHNKTKRGHSITVTPLLSVYEQY